MTRRSALFIRGVAALALLPGTAACATLLRTALAKAGIEDDGGGSGGAMVAGPAFAAASPGSHGRPVSIYQQAPAPRLWRLGLGQFHSVAYGATPSIFPNRCAFEILGNGDVAPETGDVPPVDVAKWGTERMATFAMEGVYMAVRFPHEGSFLSAHVLAETARRAAYGEGCGTDLFFAVVFGSPNATNPHPVARE